MSLRLRWAKNDMCAQRRLWSDWASAQSDQSSLGCPVWSESWRKLGTLATHWVHSEDSDQTGWMPRLIWSSLGTQPFCWFCHKAAQISYTTWKSVFGVCNPIRLKLAYSVTEASKSLRISDIAYYLKSVSSQCAGGKLSPAWKPEVHPKFFNGKKLFKNVILQILNFILIS